MRKITVAIAVLARFERSRSAFVLADFADELAWPVFFFDRAHRKEQVIAFKRRGGLTESEGYEIVAGQHKRTT